MQPLDWVRAMKTVELSQRNADPAGACRPFDADRDGQVRGEGACALVLEDRRLATAHGARILARILGWSSSCDLPGEKPGGGLRRAVLAALRAAELGPAEVGHINAHGLSTVASDRVEAHVWHELLPAVPVTAPKSFFGNLGAASGSVEGAASILAFVHGLVPRTLNYHRPAADCPVPVVTEPLSGRPATAVLANVTPAGQAAVLIIAGA
jgi:3-oxoacyl-[acyl-carrier-protein] synthase II